MLLRNVQVVLLDDAIQPWAGDTENAGGLPLVATSAFQNALDMSGFGRVERIVF